MELGHVAADGVQSGWLNAFHSACHQAVRSYDEGRYALNAAPPHDWYPWAHIASLWASLTDAEYLRCIPRVETRPGRTDAILRQDQSPGVTPVYEAICAAHVVLNTDWGLTYIRTVGPTLSARDPLSYSRQRVPLMHVPEFLANFADTRADPYFLPAIRHTLSAPASAVVLVAWNYPGVVDLSKPGTWAIRKSDMAVQAPETYRGPASAHTPPRPIFVGYKQPDAPRPLPQPSASVAFTKRASADSTEKRPSKDWRDQIRGLRDAQIRSRAAADLATEELERAIATAYAQGHTQVEIAEALGVSQPLVHRLIRRGKNADTAGPLALARRYRAGFIDRERLLNILAAVKYTVDSDAETLGYNDLPDPGNWSEVIQAHRAGYLTDDDYAELAARVFGSPAVEDPS